MFDEYFPALETIQEYCSVEAAAFHPASPLMKELTALFSEALEYKENLLEGQDPVSYMIGYTRGKVAPKFKAIVKKYTGIVISEFILSKQACGSFMNALDWGKSKDEAWSTKAIAEQAVGKDFHDGKILLTNNVRSYIREIMTDDNDYLRSNVVGLQGYKMEIHVRVLFDPYTTFLAQEVMHHDLVPLTPEEIATIMLHELGHPLSTIEHAADTCHRLQTMNKTRNVTIKGLNSEEKFKLLKDFSKDRNLKKTAPKLHKAVVVATEFLQKRDFSNVLLDTFINVVIPTLLMACYGIVSMLVTNIVGATIKNYNELYGMMTKKKVGDAYVDNKTYTLLERRADEFAVRHGASEFLISSRSKLKTISSFYRLHQHGLASYSSSAIYQMVEYGGLIRYMYRAVDPVNFGKYESDVDRDMTITKDLLKVFKKHDLPPDVQDYYIKQYESTVKALKDAKKQNRGKRAGDQVAKLIGWLVEIPNPMYLSKLLLMGNSSKKCKELMGIMDDLEAHELSFKAYKLEQLARRR